MKAKAPTPADALAAAVFDRYGPELHKFLVRRLGRQQDAHDLAQEVYLRLLRFSKAEFVREPHAYVYFVATQVVAQFQMRRSGEPVKFDSNMVEHQVEFPTEFRHDALADQVGAERQVERLLKSLPVMHRNVMLLRLRDGFSWNEIAEQLGISAHTVKKYICEAHARLNTMKWER